MNGGWESLEQSLKRRAKIERFEDIRAWQMARALCKASRRTELARDFAFSNQLRVAPLFPFMANIAEGFERYDRIEFHRFFRRSPKRRAPRRALCFMWLWMRNIVVRGISRICRAIPRRLEKPSELYAPRSRSRFKHRHFS